MKRGVESMALQKDMTVGKPGKIIVGFTLPIIIGNVFQQFYNMADTMIVGKFVGTKALAAVGSTGTIMFLILGFVLGMTTGFTMLTAQRFGAGDMKAMRQTVGSALILSVIMAAVLTLGSMLCMKPLLLFMKTPEDIFADAYTYIMIICAGIFAQMFYNLFASILRALGNSKIPLYFLVLAAILNIVLDLVFILVFRMRTAGAAWATVAAQGISAVLCFGYIVKKVPLLRLGKEDFKMKSHVVKIQLSIGFPMALQFSITAIGTMMVQMALNILGSVQVAAFTVAGKIEQITNQVYGAMGTTMATYCAQNIGAGNVKRIRQGFGSVTVMGCVYAIVSGMVIAFGGKYMTYLFVSGDISQIMGLVDIYLKCIVIFQIPLLIVNVYRSGIQGMGYGLLPMTAGVAELVGRGIVAVIAAKKHSYVGVCLASPAAWVLAGGLLLFMYFYIMKHDMKRYESTGSLESQKEPDRYPESVYETVSG